MTPLATLSFFGIMLALAAMPSSSVALVVARSASLGLRNGISVTAGIVLGDLIFATIAILGMSALALSMGSIFSVMKYLGGVYLIWIGWKLLRAKESQEIPVTDSRNTTLFASFASGLFLTLGDLKAILFYASLFPTLMDVTRLTHLDIVIIFAVTIITVGSVKLAYAAAAKMIVTRLRSRRTSLSTQKIAGGLMIGTGTYILTKA